MPHLIAFPKDGHKKLCALVPRKKSFPPCLPALEVYPETMSILKYVLKKETDNETAPCVGQ